MKTQSETKTVLEIADGLTLQIKEITTGMNGYPQGLGDYAIIGFDTYQQAEDFANEHGCEVSLFKIRDGHQLWTNLGRKHEPLTDRDYLEDLSDNYWQASKEMCIETFKNILADMLEKFEGDFSDIDTLIAGEKELLEAIENCSDDEIIITGSGFKFGHYDTCKKVMMQYHYDVTTYAVGVFVEGGISKLDI